MRPALFAFATSRRCTSGPEHLGSIPPPRRGHLRAAGDLALLHPWRTACQNGSPKTASLVIRQKTLWGRRLGGLRPCGGPTDLPDAGDRSSGFLRPNRAACDLPRKREWIPDRAPGVSRSRGCKGSNAILAFRPRALSAKSCQNRAAQKTKGKTCRPKNKRQIRCGSSGVHGHRRCGSSVVRPHEARGSERTSVFECLNLRKS